MTTLARLISRRLVLRTGAAGLVSAALRLNPAWSQGRSTTPANLILRNGRITTLARPGEVSAVAVRDGLIGAIGSDAEVMRLAGSNTRVIDLQGRRVIPGLNDSHTHAVRGGRFYNLELRWDGVDSLRRALAMIAEQAARTPSGQWVRVIGGWSPYQFAERRMPTVQELNAAAPETPTFVLFLYSRGYLNRAGVDRLGITPQTRAPEGSRYEFVDGGAVLHATPNPTILYQTIGKLPEMSAEDALNSTRHFYRELNRFGLTSAIDAGGGGHRFPDNYEATKALAEGGGLPLRISFYLFPQQPGRELQDFRAWIAANESGRDLGNAHAHGYELEGAGEFLVWSAGDFENFMAPRPELAEVHAAELREVTDLLVRNHWPLRIHATYDESISRILDVFEEVFRAHSFRGRWIIDHAETISDANIARVKRLGGGIAIQNRMAFGGEYFVDRYGQQAAARAPHLRKLVASGVPLGAGTDATRVSSYNPWLALYWMISGKTVGGTELYPSRNRLSREEALRLFTHGSAWFSGEENVKGLVVPGRFADVAVLSEDYFAVQDAAIPSIESMLTLVGGDIVYGAGPYAELAPPLPPASPAWSPVSTYGGYYKATK